MNRRHRGERAQRNRRSGFAGAARAAGASIDLCCVRHAPLVPSDLGASQCWITAMACDGGVGADVVLTLRGVRRDRRWPLWFCVPRCLGRAPGLDDDAAFTATYGYGGFLV